MTALLARARFERNTHGAVSDDTRARLARLGITAAKLESYLLTIGDQ